MEMEVEKEEPVENIVHVRSDDGCECRICLKYSEEFYDLFQDDEDIPQKIMAFASIQIEHGDGLPTTICLPCRHLLDMSYNFKCQVEKSDATLRKILLAKLNLDEAVEKESLAQCVDAVISEAITDDALGDHKASKDCETIPHNEQTQVVQDITINDFNVAQDEVTYQIITACSSGNETAIDKDPIEDCQRNDLLNNFVQKDEIICKSEITRASEMSTVLLDDQEQPEIPIEDQTELENEPAKSNSIKEEELSLSDGNEFSDGEENLQMEEIIFPEKELKFQIKTNSLLENQEECHDTPNSSKLSTENLSNSFEENNDSDEEKPLICRTRRQKCPHCIKTFATKLFLQRHMSIHKHKTKLRYVCYLCDKQFSNVAKLKTHVSNNHDSLKNDTRIDTDDNFGNIESENSTENIDKSNSELPDKQKLEKKSLKLKCNVCAKQFTYQKSFMSHIKTHTHRSKSENSDNSSEQLAAIDESPGNQTDSSNSKMNESEDDDLPLEGLQCTQCGKLFATKRNLKRHISTHSGLKFNCSTCGKEFSRLDKLKEHEQSKHKEEIFDQSEDEDDDTENEGKPNDGTESRRKQEKKCRPHQCTLCPKAFAQAQSLANHMERHKRVKEPQKRFLCEVCSKCFAQSGSLVAHMRTHTGVKPYVCNVCTRAFTKSTYLQLHLRTHSGEKPYICQYCSRAFARANTLARHITMHTGEAKYHCQICMKSFRRLTSLNEHTYTHTGQRPYACKICSKRYNNAGSLYAHTKKCRAQQLSGSAASYTVSVDNANHHSNNTGPVPQMLIYTQRKILPNEPQVTQGQTPQFMITTVQGQKPLSNNITQPFTVADPHFYALDGKQFKNPYYTIYPNM